jgi:hypothetical protein
MKYQTGVRFADLITSGGRKVVGRHDLLMNLQKAVTHWFPLSQGLV